MAYRKFRRGMVGYKAPRRPKSGLAKVTQGVSLAAQIIRLLRAIFR
jgi:hypothetical protein